MRNISVIISTLVLTVVGAQSLAQNSPIVEKNAAYRSQEDELLTLQKMAVLPSSDNMEGIYARPLENHLIELIKKNHHWDFVEVTTVGPLLSPDDLESSPEKVQQISSSINADTFLVSKISKGPNGITIKLSMFSTKDNKLFSQAVVKDYKRFEIEELKDQMELLLKQVLSKIPYEGLVLSRKGETITTNIGKRDGIAEGAVVTVIQIIKSNRHPKFGFMINTEKEILGKVKILKVDETLSFGKIITEKEKGVIQKNSKISGLDFVKYGEAASLSNTDSETDSLAQRPDSDISFGKNAQQWLPKRTPTFGQIGARLNLGMYNVNQNQSAQSLNGSNPYYPSFTIDGELWLTPYVTIHAALKQGIVTLDNPKSGSSPTDLSQTLSYYEFMLGYNFRLGADIWGPQVELLFGLADYKLAVDHSSPQGLTTAEFSGYKLGVKGSYPVTPDGIWSAGAQLYFFYKPRLIEKPVTSGEKDESSINQFGIFVAKKLSINLKAMGGLDLEQYSATFTGTGTGLQATSLSQRHTILSAGLYYMF